MVDSIKDIKYILYLMLFPSERVSKIFEIIQNLPGQGLLMFLVILVLAYCDNGITKGIYLTSWDFESIGSETPTLISQINVYGYINM